jgi:hypothetical protein
MMDRREFVLCAVAAAFAPVSRLAAQATTLAPNLAALADAKKLTVVNRTASSLTDGARKGVRLSAAAGEGMAFLPDVDFRNGTIALDLRGKDVPQQSFVGIVFHAANGAAVDAIYFRPFNFKAADPVSRGHAVQYHSTPTYGWQALRTDDPGQYEHPVNPVPDPNDWFHARVVVADPRVSVFVGNAEVPSLVVNLLNNRRAGMVGLWVGNNSGGDFANLTITPS